jgi:hypothetical protein
MVSQAYEAPDIISIRANDLASFGDAAGSVHAGRRHWAVRVWRSDLGSCWELNELSCLLPHRPG